MDEDELDFCTFCIESLSERLNEDPEKIYKSLRVDSNIIDSYIIPHYETLHKKSKSNIVDELIEVMKKS